MKKLTLSLLAMAFALIQSQSVFAMGGHRPSDSEPPTANDCLAKIRTYLKIEKNAKTTLDGKTADGKCKLFVNSQYSGAGADSIETLFLTLEGDQKSEDWVQVTSVDTYLSTDNELVSYQIYSCSQNQSGDELYVDVYAAGQSGWKKNKRYEASFFVTNGAISKISMKESQYADFFNSGYTNKLTCTF